MPRGNVQRVEDDIKYLTFVCNRKETYYKFNDTAKLLLLHVCLTVLSDVLYIDIDLQAQQDIAERSLDAKPTKVGSQWHPDHKLVLRNKNRLLTLALDAESKRLYP